jgi:hypothetical protein
MHTQFDKVTNIPNCTMKQISREILIGKSPEWESWLVTRNCASKLPNFHLDFLETSFELRKDEKKKIGQKCELL